MGYWYTTLEAVKTALDVQQTARNDAQVRRAVEGASRAVEGILLRRFYPWTGTRRFATLASRPSYQLPLGRNELVSATTVVSDGTTIDPADYDLQPAPGLAEGGDGPPYNRIDLVQSAYSAWPGGSVQDAVAITGVWGYRADEEAVGTLAAELGSAAAASATVTWNTARIGTGDILRVDDERVVVRARTFVDSGQNLGGAGLTASMASVAVTVTTGTAYAVDEVLQVDAEQLLVTAVTGNTLTVVRAHNGTVLAAHTAGVDVYALTGVELDRGQLGTTAAAHLNGAAIYRHLVPGLVADLCVAEALNRLQQETGGYGATQRSGESAVTVSLGGLAAIREDAKAAYRRHRTWMGV